MCMCVWMFYTSVICDMCMYVDVSINVLLKYTCTVYSEEKNMVYHWKDVCFCHWHGSSLIIPTSMNLPVLLENLPISYAATSVDCNSCSVTTAFCMFFAGCAQLGYTYNNIICISCMERLGLVFNVALRGSRSKPRCRIPGLYHFTFRKCWLILHFTSLVRLVVWNISYFSKSWE